MLPDVVNTSSFSSNEAGADNPVSGKLTSGYTTIQNFYAAGRNAAAWFLMFEFLIVFLWSSTSVSFFCSSFSLDLQYVLYRIGVIVE